MKKCKEDKTGKDVSFQQGSLNTSQGSLDEFGLVLNTDELDALREGRPYFCQGCPHVCGCLGHV